MTRAYHPPSYDADGPHHYEGDIHEGRIVDVRVPHCPRHKDYLLDGCELCASRPTEGAVDATD